MLISSAERDRVFRLSARRYALAAALPPVLRDRGLHSQSDVHSKSAVDHANLWSSMFVVQGSGECRRRWSDPVRRCGVPSCAVNSPVPSFTTSTN